MLKPVAMGWRRWLDLFVRTGVTDVCWLQAQISVSKTSQRRVGATILTFAQHVYRGGFELLLIPTKVGENGDCEDCLTADCLRNC